MVRFSDIVITDAKIGRDVPSSVEDFRREYNGARGKRIRAHDHNKVPVDLPPALKGNDEVRTYYRLLFERVAGIRKRVEENREVYPYLTASIFRYILENKLLDDFQKYAASVPKEFAPISHIISVALAHLNKGIKMGHDANSVLRMGFDAIIRNADLGDGLDPALQGEWVLTPEEIALIKKQRPAKGTLASLMTEPGISKVKGEAKAGEGILNENNFESERGDAERMEIFDDTHKDLTGMSQKKSSVLLKILLGVVVLVLVAIGILWFTGQYLGDRGKDPARGPSKEQQPLALKKKIQKEGETPGPVSAPLKEAPQLPEEQPPLNVEMTPPSADKPPEFAKTPRPANVSRDASLLPQDAVSQRPLAPLFPPEVENYPYSLHAGSFKTIERTEEGMKDLIKKGLSPYWVRVDLGEKGKWYRIFVGQFSDTVQAKQFLEIHGMSVARVLKTGYAVQVGIFELEEALKREMDALKEAGYYPYVKQANDRYELLVGAYQRKSNAEDAAAELKASGVDCEVISR